MRGPEGCEARNLVEAVASTANLPKVRRFIFVLAISRGERFAVRCVYHVFCILSGERKQRMPSDRINRLLTILAVFHWCVARFSQLGTP